MKIVSTLVEAHIVRMADDEFEFLLLKRAEGEKYPNIWQMVTGAIEDGEKAFETALREIKEETGLSPEKLWIVPQVNSFYSSEKDEVCIIPVFAALISPESKVIISEEHSEFKWQKKEEAKQYLAWPGQRDSVDTIYEYLTKENSAIKFIEIPLN